MKGLIALSGCLSGEIPYLIGQKDMAGAMAVAGEFQEIFGKDHFYLEVQANGLDHQTRSPIAACSRSIRNWTSRWPAPTIAII